ncbi:MAG: hypothetical protein HY801_15760, partial [Candidatus Lindowbacteria bacterium]|nr:hypothetical protein [Candidatus Lindowbacteria bacterium]
MESAEKKFDDRYRDEYAFVMPDLVIKELIAAIIASIGLLVWSMAVNAPLLSIADANKTENPAKAPWYFVGLQELLVYFDPWIAGVTIPTLIILGLMLIPYLDVSKAGVGTYRLRGRKAAASSFIFGFSMWVILILVGQFLRGPNWQFYWPWEDWAVAKSAEETLVNMSQWSGTGLLALYFGVGLALPAVLYRKFLQKMGVIRYLTAMTL